VLAGGVVLPHHGVGRFPDPVRVAQCHAGAAETGARETRAVDARLLLQQGHEPIQFARGHFVIVAQARVRGVHQCTELLRRAARDRLQHAGVLGHHVARPPLQQLGQRVEPAHVVDVAQGRHAEQPRRFLALRAPLVVAAAGQRARDPGVEHQHGGPRRQIDEAALQAARVQQQGARRVGEAGGHLVHDPAVDAGMLDLGALRELRDQHVVEVEAQQLAQAAQGGDLQRGARREPDADRHVGLDVDLQSGHIDTATAHQHQAAVDVAGEMLRRRCVEREPHGLALPLRVQREPGRGHAAHGHPRALRDRDRQDEAVVVVRVLAQQVHAAGRVGRRVGPLAEDPFEPGAVRAAHSATSTCCSSRAFSSGKASIAKKPAASSVPARYFRRSRVRYGG
jgi:hypothetical protein